MSNQELLAQIAALKAENDALKNAKTNRALSFKVSEKGAVSVYGMGRFPVTLYKQQWIKLLDTSEAIKAFIIANEASLSEKPAPVVKAA